MRIVVDWVVPVQINHVQINWEEQLGSETDHETQGSSGKLKTQNLWLYKSVGVEVGGETARLTGEFFGETHGVL